MTTTDTSSSTDHIIEKHLDALQKQRRNFVIGSFFLCFIAIGDVSLDRLSTSGLSLTIQNPSAAYWFIWVAVTYFGIRYFQFLWPERRQLFSDSYAMSMNEAIARRSVQELLSPSNDVIAKTISNAISKPFDGCDKFITTSSAYIESEENGNWIIRAFFECPPVNPKTRPISNKTKIGDIKFTVAQADIWKLKIKALVHWVVETHYCTEFAAPVFLYMTAIVTNVICDNSSFHQTCSYYLAGKLLPGLGSP